ncbi:hypothetical protein ACFT7S_30975 [Streptomyces sp. NPDC057136]|uniref:hypothetical protein n=1 Tax=Streptomyces sp. NPDC057136 TaxID=3346029 RepID=UPI0036261B79
MAAHSYDNATAETLNGTFKAELIEMQDPWKDVAQAERAIPPPSTNATSGGARSAPRSPQSA